MSRLGSPAWRRRRYATDRRYVLVENPSAVGRDRSKLEPACHDRSRFLTIGCSGCGGFHHIHETQIPADARARDVLAVRCTCRTVCELQVGWLRAALDEAWS